MSNVLEDLTEKRRKVWEDQKKVLDGAYERPLEQRSLTSDEQHKVFQMDGELEKLDVAIADYRAGEQRALQSQAVVENTTRQAPDRFAPQGGSGKTAEQEAQELRTFFSPENRNGMLQRTYEIPLPNAIERRAIMEQRALGDAVQGNITTSAPLPTSFVGQLYRYLVDTSSIRQTNPTIYSTASGEQLVIPKSISEGSAQWVAEGANLPVNDPAFSTVVLGAHKVSKLLQISSELLADSGFDIVGYLAEHAGRNLGIAVDTGYVAGTGTTQPLGFLASAVVGYTAATGTGSVTGFPTGTGTVVGADVLIELYHSILPQYRARSSFVMNDQTIKVVRKLKDSTGQYIWQPALVAGQPDTVLGRPTFADPNMPLIGTSSKPVAFGDFAGYFIRDVTPIRFERSDDYAFGQDLISVRAVYRTDGQLGDTQAIKVYQTAAS